MALSHEAAARKDCRTGMAELERRHFATIAKIINDMPQWVSGDARDEFDENDRRLVADYFADRLRATNPKFNRRRFLDACGV